MRARENLTERKPSRNDGARWIIVCLHVVFEVVLAQHPVSRGARWSENASVVTEHHQAHIKSANSSMMTSRVSQLATLSRKIFGCSVELSLSKTTITDEARGRRPRQGTRCLEAPETWKEGAFRWCRGSPHINLGSRCQGTRSSLPGLESRGNLQPSVRP